MTITYFKTTTPKPASAFRFWEVHHYFIGEFLFLLFSFLGFYGIFIWSIWLVRLFGLATLISLWVIIDDWIQHLIQRGEIEKTGEYKTVSFWHWIWYKKYWR